MYLVFQKDTANDKWTSTFKESCDMALTLDSTCCAIYLMQAILHLRNNNQRSESSTNITT